MSIEFLFLNFNPALNRNRLHKNRITMTIKITIHALWIFGRLDELRERILLLRHHALVAHQFVKPRLAAER
jgi:hypothetical protein